MVEADLAAARRRRLNHARTRPEIAKLAAALSLLIDPVEDGRLDDWLRAEPPMNLDRARAVMARFDLQGLVLGEPTNVFHASGYWPQIANTKTGFPPTTFVLLSRDPSLALGLVTSRFIHYYTFADGRFTSARRDYLYLDGGADSGSGALVEGPIDDFPDRGAEPLSPLERKRRAAIDVAGQARATFADAGGALAGAMRDMGLWRGRIGYDSPVIAEVCARREHPGDLVSADLALRWIRLIKSPLEIALMRRAATANAVAVRAVGATLRVGMTYGEVQATFAVEAARRGNRAVFMTVDRASSELVDGAVAEGQTFFIDGVSQHRRYHGDFARTVCIGEPAKAAATAAKAAAHGWDVIRDRLRPGLRYSEIVALGQDAVRAAGYATTMGFGPHSVGLMHTDEPGENAGGFYGKFDLILRENMIVSIDCPVLDTGIGGSAHIEDLMLITADGAEPIHPLDDVLISE